TDFVGEIKIRSGRRVMARVIAGIFVVSEAGGKEPSSVEISRLPALTVSLLRANARTHRPKATEDKNRMTDSPTTPARRFMISTGRRRAKAAARSDLQLILGPCAPSQGR